MMRKFSVLLKRKYRQYFSEKLSRKDIEKLQGKNFVIISNNCWGGAVYQWFKRPYNTPFIGLFLYGPCYMKLLSNFDYYMDKPLEFIKTSKYPDREPTYPIAIIHDIEIHFTHYKSEEEALEKWKRRTKRMREEKNSENYFFKICDRERVTEEHIKQFHELPFKNKLSFSLNNLQLNNNINHIKIVESHKNNKKFVPNGKKLFKLTFLYFDLNSWLLQ